MRRLLILHPLRHRPFRLLFAGQAVSDLGDWLDLLALLFLIAFRWRLGPAALSALVLAQLLPFALIGSFAGVLADRWPRRATLVGCDLARAAIVLGLLWAPNLPALLLLVAAKLTLSTLFGPARQATIRATVPEADLLSANALSRLSFQSSKVIGPSLGGVLVAVVGARAAFAVDAATFLASAAFLARLPALPRLPDEAAQAAPAFRRELRAGFGYIRRSRALRLLVGAMTAEYILVAGSDSSSVLVLQRLALNEAAIGRAIGCAGLGNILASIAIGQWGHRHNAFTMLAAGLMLAGFIGVITGGAAAASIAAVPAVWLVVSGITGVAFAAIWTPYAFLIQRETEPALMGRVSASALALCSAGGLAGPPLGAALAKLWSVGAMYAALYGVLVLVGITVFGLIPRPRAAAIVALAGAQGEG